LPQHFLFLLSCPEHAGGEELAGSGRAHWWALMHFTYRLRRSVRNQKKNHRCVASRNCNGDSRSPSCWISFLDPKSIVEENHPLPTKVFVSTVQGCEVTRIVEQIGKEKVTVSNQTVGRLGLAAISRKTWKLILEWIGAKGHAPQEAFTF
jgi:hypothetical protein